MFDHIDWVAGRYFEEQEIQRMDWPVCSLDMNLIVHVWDKR